MNQQQQSPMGDIAKLLVIRGMEGESRIIEEWKDIVASRHTVRVKQWLGAMAGLLLSFVGLGLIGVPVAMGIGAVTVLDALLLGTIVGTVAAAYMAGSAWLMRRHSAAAQVIVAGLASTLTLSAVVFASLELGEAEWYHALAAVVGLVVLAPSLAFTFNQSVDLVDPMGWVSAFERRMAPWLEAMIHAEVGQPVIRERSLIPWRHSGHKPNGENKVTGRPWPPAPLPIPEADLTATVVDVPAQDDLTFADFLEESTRRGLGRRAWLPENGPRYLCPTTNQRITRTMYDRMIAMAAAEGYITLGGEGDAAAWLIEPSDAYSDWCRQLEDEWGDLLSRL